ncbi:glycosyltransferase [Metamycoplasma equirhinis]|uniref:glycosyltransferase n=1 Tax=Metamycoplasma equirhinis TaxID=92402 RepID=UPI003594880C
MKKNNNLTIVVPIYKPTISIDDIIYNLLKQKDQNFNTVIVIDKPTESDLESLSKLKSKFDKRLEIIINSSHLNLSQVLKQTIEYVQTEYTYILFSYVTLKSGFVKNINCFLDNEIHPDYIELLSTMSGVIEHKLYGSFFESGKLINIENNALPLALTAPFSFTFLAKTKIIKEVIEGNKYKGGNLQYSPFYSIRSLLLSKTYVFLDTTWVTDYNHEVLILNPKSLNKSWQIIKGYIPGDLVAIQQALEFAKFLNFYYYFAGYLGGCKTKSKSLKGLKNLLESELKTIDLDFDKFAANNPYFKLYDSKQIREFALDSRKWNSIFKKVIWQK